MMFSRFSVWCQMGEMETEKRLHLLDNEIMYEPQ